MKLNCKQGDLAMMVYIDGLTEKGMKYVGRVFRCVSSHVIDGAPAWLTEPEVRSSGGGLIYIDDSILRPLRGDLLNDETTTSKELEAV